MKHARVIYLQWTVGVLILLALMFARVWMVQAIQLPQVSKPFLKSGSMECVPGPNELCVPITWSVSAADGSKESASVRKSLNGASPFPDCNQRDTSMVKGTYIVIGLFIPPGAGWKLLDGHGFQNQLFTIATVSGNLDVAAPDGLCPSYARAYLDNAINVRTFSDAVEDPGSQKTINPPPLEYGPIEILLPNQQPGAVGKPFEGRLVVDASLGMSAFGNFVLAEATYSLNPRLGFHTTYLKYIESNPPSCQLIALQSGPPAKMKIVFQDTQSGLDSIAAHYLINADLTIPAFNTGTTAPMVVTATKIDPDQQFIVKLRANDMAANSIVCEHNQAFITAEEQTPQVLTGISGEKRFVTVLNGNPGLDTLHITVNETDFTVAGLTMNEQRTVEVKEALVPGSNNTIEFRAEGPEGAAAEVVVWEGVPPSSLFLPLVIRR